MLSAILSQNKFIAGPKLRIVVNFQKRRYIIYMKSTDIRNTFLEFFKGKGHQIVDSAPIVLKNDPTLMFTNAGMNQFKDYFLGNKEAQITRLTDTQKCLRVSGKQNDLEEVGVDTYHHTMFEMLGNWSFGDYFKKEAISWAWELLTEVYKIPKDRLYVSIFEGAKEENLELDNEAKDIWKQFISEDRILEFDKKDNFWEMGDTGPCGPCSEIHVDIRDDDERAKQDGKTLVNMDHPEVIEIWNLVFIQFNRKANGELETLPAAHIDTGMGFERLAMVLQGVKSNYDTDIFVPLMNKVSEITGVKQGKDKQSDIAIKVLADHIRAISFTITDGQLPSNTGAGYVIRRILRRAVRYSYSVLNYKEPILFQLLPVLADQFADVFPELKANQDFVGKVILEEENSFLKTLASGLKRFDQIKDKNIDGATAFELYDTFGFPLDLTKLMASEVGIEVDEAGFDAAMKQQKERARAASVVETGDWNVLIDQKDVAFVGYDEMETFSKITKYRKVNIKKKDAFQIVLDKTPFYAESGGQVGDVGILIVDGQEIKVKDTQKENDLIIHIVDKMPSNPEGPVIARINIKRRNKSNANHSATHLLHAALKNILGEHVNQKGSLVHPDQLRFDFSHFAKVEEQDLHSIEKMINEKIRANISLDEKREVPFDEAVEMGAMALFGEKYGNEVRVITFDKDYSVELCGGTHVKATGEIGFCKIITETSVAAGVRRIEALTGEKAYEWMNKELAELEAVRSVFKNPKGVVERVQKLSEENTELRKSLDQFERKQAGDLKNVLKGKIEDLNGIKFISEELEIGNADLIKQISFDLQREVPGLLAVFGANLNGKPHLSVIMDKELPGQKGLNASTIIRQIAKHIKGGGGGQDFYATAGGKETAGLGQAISEARSIAEEA